MSDIIEFHKSISIELKAIQNRVRLLIKDANYAEEGRYKEAIVKNLIRKYLPNNLSIGTGFIVKNENEDVVTSKQIDIIIYDNTYPYFFKEGDFVITTGDSVKAIIEVKTKINSPSELAEIFEKCISNSKFITTSYRRFLYCFDKQNFHDSIFNGVFSFESELNIDSSSFKNVLKQNKNNVNHLCLGKDYFIKLWPRGIELSNDNIKHMLDFYNIYRIQDLAFSYFISNLLSTISSPGLGLRNWFLFPIKGTKEIHRIDTIELTD